MKQPDLLMIAVEDSRQPMSFGDINDYTLQLYRNAQLQDYNYPNETIYSAANGARTQALDRSFNLPPNYAPGGLRSELGASQLYPAGNNNEYVEQPQSYGPGEPQLAAMNPGAMYGDVGLGPILEGTVMPEAAPAVSGAQIAPYHNHNDAMSVGYFGIHAEAVAPINGGDLLADPIGGRGATALESAGFTNHLGLAHRHSFPTHAYNGAVGHDYCDNYADTKVLELPNARTLPTTLSTPSVGRGPSLLSNYVLDQRREALEMSEGVSPRHERLMQNPWNGQLVHGGDSGDAGKGPDSSGHNEGAIPMSCMSAQERWNAHWKKYNGMPDPQESMMCAHCDVKFDDVGEYLTHLDVERVKHENFCPDPTCAFAVIGFRFRWLLRRHICNHHLKVYNSESAKQLLMKDHDKLLQQFLSHVYVCNEHQCSRAFYRLDSLLRHQRLIHGSGKKRTRKEKLKLGKLEMFR